jgi:hypothetical protein
MHDRNSCPHVLFSLNSDSSKSALGVVDNRSFTDCSFASVPAILIRALLVMIRGLRARCTQISDIWVSIAATVSTTRTSAAVLCPGPPVVHRRGFLLASSSRNRRPKHRRTKPGGLRPSKAVANRVVGGDLSTTISTNPSSCALPNVSSSLGTAGFCFLESFGRVSFRWMGSVAERRRSLSWQPAAGPVRRVLRSLGRAALFLTSTLAQFCLGPRFAPSIRRLGITDDLYNHAQFYFPIQ